MKTVEDEELQQRLSLYQVFLKLYNHHRDLLDEILQLENRSSRALAGVTLPYVQGVSVGQPHLVTNLMQGKTQALFQPQQTWVIGRHLQRANICIPDQQLSRVHVALKYVENQGFYLIDLGSRNGSYVNGELIRQSRQLQDGDRVRLGSLSFVFLCCETARALPELTEPIATLQNWQPGSSLQLSPPPNINDFGEEATAPLTAPATAANPLEETFTFMRHHVQEVVAPIDN
ncbi:MAG TPA: FHA domain-containing protein [Trichocoleus sp.]